MGREGKKIKKKTKMKKEKQKKKKNACGRQQGEGHRENNEQGHKEKQKG